MKIIAHGTTSEVYPPNSIESLLFLVGHGIRAVEFDVCKISGGRLVVAHPGLIEKEKLESASSFIDFLRVCSSISVNVFIDVKFTHLRFDRSFLNSVMETILEVGMEKRSVIISWSEKALSLFRGRIATGHITSEIKSESYCLYDMLLVPITKFQGNVILSERWKRKLVATEVDISNVQLVQKFSPYAIMTNHAIQLQALIKQRRQ